MPVIINIVHREDTLQEYEDVIDIKLTTQTPEGSSNIGKFFYLQEGRGYSREEAIFTLASDAVEKYVKQSVSKLDIAKRLAWAQHELHVPVERNGNIAYRRPLYT